MSQVALATVGRGTLDITDSPSAQLLLIDSAFETISTKRMTVHKNIAIRLWRRIKALHELQQANPGCAVYWCSLDKFTDYLCVSNLSLHERVETDLNSYLAQSTQIKRISGLLAIIGSGLAEPYKDGLIVLEDSLGIRHVYIVDRKPVFIRLLPLISHADAYIEPLQATLQHLSNRGLLNGEPTILCHGLSATAQSSIKQNWASGNVSPLCNAGSYLLSLDMRAH